MLSICKISSSRAAAYYLATLPGGGGHGPVERERRLVEPLGYWLGEGAEELGLGGSVVPLHVTRLLDGLHPRTGSPLLERSSRAQRSVAAYDCTFSCPKSLSLLHALGPPEAVVAVREAHDSAVSAALGYLEREASRYRLRSKGAQPSIPGDGVVAAVFPHRTSRAPDPHLHSHVLVANLVREAGGGWRSLDARKWYRESRTAAALYETHLRCELTQRLGVQFRDLAGRPWADVVGVQAGWTAEFSRRGREIRAALLESQLDARAIPIVAGVTRPEKDFDTPYEDHVGAWRERGYSVGLAEPFLAAVTHRPLAVRPPGMRHDDVRLTVNLALEHSYDRSFSRSELIKARCATAQEGLSVVDVERDVDRLLEGAERPDGGPGRIVRRAAVLRFAGRGAPGLPVAAIEDRYTTRDVVMEEARLVDIVRADPSRFKVVAYGAGSRLQALDAVSGTPSKTQPAGDRLALAPGPVAARAFEALTGVPAADSVAALREMALRRQGGTGSVEAVLVDPHTMKPGELRAAIEELRDGPLTLLVSAKAAERDPLLNGIAGTARSYEVPARPSASEPRLAAPAGRAAATTAGTSNGTRTRLDFGDVSVTLASGPLEAVAALRETLEALAAPRRPGMAAGRDESRPTEAPAPPVVVATGEIAVARHLRSFDIGVPVLEPRELRRLPSSTPAHVVILGGAAELRLAQRQLDGLRRTHVLVAPAMSGPAGHPLGARARSRVAELVRPRYLVAELGVPPGATAGREKWRRGAAVVEEYRERHSFHDAKRAFESPALALGLPAARRAELTRTVEQVQALRRETRELSRPIDRSLGRGRSSDRGLGR